MLSSAQTFAVSRNKKSRKIQPKNISSWCMYNNKHISSLLKYFSVACQSCYICIFTFQNTNPVWLNSTFKLFGVINTLIKVMLKCICVHNLITKTIKSGNPQITVCSMQSLTAAPALNVHTFCSRRSSCFSSCLTLQRGWNNFRWQVQLITQELNAFISQIPVIVAPSILLFDITTWLQWL